MLLADRSWAAVERRARYFGITPGTLVDARGRAVRAPATAGPNPCVGQIMPVGFNFATRGFALCEGQLLPIAQYTAVFSLLGTFYGGDGRTTFGLPDLRGRSPMHLGQGPGLSARPIGQKGGAEAVTLTVAHLPSHDHPYEYSSTNTPPPNDYAASRNFSDTSDQSLDTGVGMTGGGQAHDNLAPYLVINFGIALEGVYPSRS
ncbi:MAG: tail fiber protein [Rubricoccaceae bacterium]|nr:tail fiber protein [Rubricoccaceae bacterium]